MYQNEIQRLFFPLIEKLATTANTPANPCAKHNAIAVLAYSIWSAQTSSMQRMSADDNWYAAQRALNNYCNDKDWDLSWNLVV